MTNTNGCPFLDLITPHAELREELCEVFNTALDTAGFIGGPMVEGFERDFARFCDVEHCVGVSSGTDALRFALMAGGVKQGDIVVTVPNTFIATTEAISQAGALPVFVDVDPNTYNMDVDKLCEYLEMRCTTDGVSARLMDNRTGRPVSAIVPVHLYGQPVDMDPILDLAERFNLLVVEDACQAHGAEYFSRKDGRWKKAGSMGHAAAFSFYPGKNLGACGEGGAATTNDPDLAKSMRMLRDHGQAKKYYHDVEGYNGRLDAIQAGILQVKLRHLGEWNNGRRQAADRYAELLTAEGATSRIPYQPVWAKSVYHLYVTRVPAREAVIRHLAEANIGTGIHYPVPLHLQKAYEGLGYGRGDFPVSEQAALEILSLPMYPGLAMEQQVRVVNRTIEFVRLTESATPLVARAAGA